MTTTYDDDVEFDLGIDIDTDDFFSDTIPSEFKPPAETLPMTSLTSGVSPTSAFPLKSAYELTPDADKLFDFSDTSLDVVQQMFIIGYALKGTKKGACAVAGVTYSTCNKWFDNDEFNRALSNAVDIVRDSLEEELLKRALQGSDKLLLEALKAHNPEKYNKKQAEVNIHADVVHTWAELAKQAESTPVDAIDVVASVVEEDK